MEYFSAPNMEQKIFTFWGKSLQSRKTPVFRFGISLFILIIYRGGLFGCGGPLPGP